MLTNSHYSYCTFIFKRLRECTFWAWWRALLAEVCHVPPSGTSSTFSSEETADFKEQKLNKQTNEILFWSRYYHWYLPKNMPWLNHEWGNAIVWWFALWNTRILWKTLGIWKAQNRSVSFVVPHIDKAKNTLRFAIFRDYLFLDYFVWLTWHKRFPHIRVTHPLQGCRLEWKKMREYYGERRHSVRGFEMWFLSLLLPSSKKFSQPFRRKCISNVERIVSIIIFHLSELWKAKFVILWGVTFLVWLQGELELITLGSERVHANALPRWEWNSDKTVMSLH